MNEGYLSCPTENMPKTIVIKITKNFHKFGSLVEFSLIIYLNFNIIRPFLIKRREVISLLKFDAIRNPDISSEGQKEGGSRERLKAIVISFYNELNKKHLIK